MNPFQQVSLSSQFSYYTCTTESLSVIERSISPSLTTYHASRMLVWECQAYYLWMAVTFVSKRHFNLYAALAKSVRLSS